MTVEYEEEARPDTDQKEENIFPLYVEEETTISPATSSFLQSLQETLAPGINVENQTQYPILFMLSQLSPLHWCRVEPGESAHVACGRVFFTVSVEVYNPDTEPSMQRYLSYCSANKL